MKMGAGVQEELSDIAHKFVNVFIAINVWWYIGYWVISNIFIMRGDDKLNIKEELLD